MLRARNNSVSCPNFGTGGSNSSSGLKPVAPPFGQLSVNRTNLIGQSGLPVQLIGMSLFWSQWMGQFYEFNTVQALKCSWKSNVVRASMGVDQGGYQSNPSAELAKVKAVIEAAINLGIYVIIDWHSHVTYQSDAVNFFSTISRLYGAYPHIIYELFNEPTDQAWSSVLKPYHEAVIKVIRANDKKNVVVVGTRTWSQEVLEAASDPITIDPNVCYTLHFYAGSHHQELRDKAAAALSKGVCVFVSEYGTVNADGNGAVAADESNKWLSFLDQNKMSYLNWAIEDKSEGAAALQPGTTSSQVGDDSRLTASGSFVKSMMKSKAAITNVTC